jgi:predicted phage terminase large subunit-like protein
MTRTAIPAPSLDAVDALLAESSLHHFVKQAWRQVEPKEFVDGWHLQAICEHLEAVTMGQIRNLIINIPPRHTKSLTVSVMWPAWVWIRNPAFRWMFTSYAQRLSVRDSVKCRRVLQSPWYQKNWGSRYALTGDQNAKERYDTDKGGYRLATSVDGVATGEGGDALVADDPHNVREVESQLQRERVHEWWDSAMSTRRDDPKKSSRIIIMQRSHADDLTGHVEERLGGDYEFLVLPAEYDPITSRSTVIGFHDPRESSGELLWPERFGEDEILDQKNNLGSHQFAAQFNQRPSLPEGSIFKRHWFRFYPQPPPVLAEEMEFLCQSWDMAFKDTRSSDFVVGQVWGIKGANRYLLDQIRDRLSFTETLKAVRMLTSRWPKATAKYVEEKANGAAVIDTLRNEIEGLIAINPTESKESRAFAVTPECEAGNVWLPEPKLAPWVDAFIETLAQFPKGQYDDEVDAFTQALKQLKRRTENRKNLFSPMVGAGTPSHWKPMSILR